MNFLGIHQTEDAQDCVLCHVVALNIGDCTPSAPIRYFRLWHGARYKS